MLLLLLFLAFYRQIIYLIIYLDQPYNTHIHILYNIHIFNYIVHSYILIIYIQNPKNSIF